MPPRTKSVTALLAGLIAVGVLFRYPSTPHELGVDSFLFHMMATSLQRLGEAPWILNPLSYLGLYPLSHPSGGPFLVASLSDLSGVTAEGSILVVDLTVAIVGTLGGFLLGLNLTHDDRFALLLAAVFSLTPAMIGGLSWQMPTRIVFTTLLPLFLAYLIKLARKPKWQYLCFLTILLFLMAAFHRLTVLMSLIALSYLFTGIFLAVYRTLRLRKPELFLGQRFTRRAPTLAVFLVVGVAGGIITFTDVLAGYSTGVVASGNSLWIEILNLGVSLGRSSGILLPVAILGVFAISTRRNKDVTEPLMLLALITFTPLLFLRDYTGYYTVPFTSVFIAYGIIHFARGAGHRRLRFIAVVGVIGLMIASSAAITQYNIRTTSSMPSQTYSLALYVKYTTKGTVLFNEGLIGERVAAIANGPFLPVGGATTAFQSPELLIYGFVNRSGVLQQIFPLPLNELSVGSDSPFELRGVQAEGDWAYILLSPVDNIPAQYAHYNVTFLMESKWLAGQYTAYGNIYPSKLLQTADQERYVTYEDSSQSMFYLG